MANEGFYNRNAYRQYPLRSQDIGGLRPPTRLLVDAGFDILNLPSFRPGIDVVWLYQITRYTVGPTDMVSLEFRTSSPTMASLVFEFEEQGDDYRTYYEETGAMAGFVVIGDTVGLEEYLDGLAEGGPDPTGTDPDALTIIEPARLRILTESIVTNWHITNNGRTKVVPPAECGGVEEEQVIRIYAASVNNPLVITPGYNSTIVPSANLQTLTLGGLVGGGLGEPCEEVPTYPGEEAPEGSELLTGGPKCNDTIKSILGVPGPNLRITPGEGITIQPSEEDPHMLIIAADLRNLLGPTRFLEDLENSSEYTESGGGPSPPPPAPPPPSPPPPSPPPPSPPPPPPPYVPALMFDDNRNSMYL